MLNLCGEARASDPMYQELLMSNEITVESFTTGKDSWRIGPRPETLR